MKILKKFLKECSVTLSMFALLNMAVKANEMLGIKPSIMSVMLTSAALILALTPCAIAWGKIKKASK